MVLRKSEYRKNYKWFSADKRSALWLENALYRAERRQREYVHEPLGDEMDSGYEVGDSESEECGLPPTKVRQKRLQLAADAAAAKAIDADDVPTGDGSCCDDRRRRTRLSAAAVTASSTADAVDARLFAAAAPAINAATQTALPARKDKAVQTEPAEVLRLPRIKEDHHRQRNRPRNRASPRRAPNHCQRCFALWGAPFEMFGSGEEVDTVGAKRTFNVAASTTEVHPSALAAMRQRQRSPTPPPLRRKTLRPERPHSAPPKDRRLWISEYRDQYK